MSDTIYLLDHDEQDTPAMFSGPEELHLRLHDYLNAISCPNPEGQDYTLAWQWLYQFGIENWAALEQAWQEWIEQHPGVQRVHFVTLR